MRHRGLAEKKTRVVKKAKLVEKPAAVRRNGLMFDIPRQGEPVAEAKSSEEPKQKTPRVKPKNGPRLVAAARELRDRWLEQVNTHGDALLPQGKYDVSRQLEGEVIHPKQLPLLIERPAAA